MSMVRDGALLLAIVLAVLFAWRAEAIAPEQETPGETANAYQVVLEADDFTSRLICLEATFCMTDVSARGLSHSAYAEIGIDSGEVSVRHNGCEGNVAIRKGESKTACGLSISVEDAGRMTVSSR